MADDLKREGEGIRRIERLAIANRGEAAMRCHSDGRALDARAARARDLRGHRALHRVLIVTRPSCVMPTTPIQLPRLRHAARGLLPRLRRHARAALNAASAADAVWPGWGFLAEDPEFISSIVTGSRRHRSTWARPPRRCPFGWATRSRVEARSPRSRAGARSRAVERRRARRRERGRRAVTPSPDRLPGRAQGVGRRRRPRHSRRASSPARRWPRPSGRPANPRPGRPSATTDL